jgi:hypothetical protein
MKNKLFLSALIWSIALLFAACKSPGESSAPDLTDQGYIKATVKDYTGLDGCTFLIVAEDGKRFEPVGLPVEFRVHDLPVWVKYRPPAQAMGSICMVGQIVEIVEIKKR